mmetsp:Transcript_18786/g.39376  ORF Transcript_18786/g.39376 Transcript_18786/m.39376 type:complete len:254 (+) Transcript_18786:1749-2510(+)
MRIGLTIRTLIGNGVRVTDLDGLLIPFLLPLDGRPRLALGTRVEISQVLGHDLKTLGHIIVSREENAGVGGVVEFGVECGELLEAEVGNVHRVTTAVHAIRIIGEDTLLGLSLQETVGRGVDTLHFIVHHSLVRQGILHILQLQMPPLLRMHHGIANRPRMEHGVRVHIDQIVKILGILRCHDVTRPVRIRERVQKRLKRPLQQLHERILRRVLATAAQHAVFEDVGNAGAVLRGSAEGDSEALVVVVGREGE